MGRDWDGVDPVAFGVYFDWRQTYYGHTGYFQHNPGTFAKRTTDFDVDNYFEYWNWLTYNDRWAIEMLGCGVYSSPVYLDG